MDVSLNVAVQLARNEIKNTISKIKSTYKLPSYIVDGILSESVAEIRSREQAEISSDIMQMYMELASALKEGEVEDGECRGKTEFVPRSE